MAETDPNPIHPHLHTSEIHHTASSKGGIFIEVEKELWTLSPITRMIFQLAPQTEFEQLDFDFPHGIMDPTTDIKRFNECRYVREHYAWDNGLPLVLKNGEIVLPGYVIGNINNEKEVLLFSRWEQEHNDAFVALNGKSLNAHKNFEHRDAKWKTFMFVHQLQFIREGTDGDIFGHIEAEDRIELTEDSEYEIHWHFDLTKIQYRKRNVHSQFWESCDFALEIEYFENQIQSEAVRNQEAVIFLRMYWDDFHLSNFLVCFFV